MYHYVRIPDSFEVGVNNYYNFDKFMHDIKSLKNAKKCFLNPKNLSKTEWIEVSTDPNKIILTFDDGYIDHSKLVAPFLNSEGICGLFFVPSKMLVERKTLDVNKIHVMLHKFKGHESKLCKKLIEFLARERGFDDLQLSNLKSRYFKPGKYDDAITNFLKRTLQLELREEDLAKFVGEIYKYNSSNLEDLANNLYLNLEDFKLLASQGHTLGLHGHNHSYLSRLSFENQFEDISRSIDIFKENKVSDQLFFAYPYGDYNGNTLEICKSCGIEVSFIDNMKNVSNNEPCLTIPRIDCNDYFKNDFQDIIVS